MKYLCSVLLSLTLSCGFVLVLAQDLKSHALDAPEQVGASIVEALKNRDIAVLTRLVTQAGITVGTDGPTIPPAAFKRQLQLKKGVYCVLMDGACIKGTGKNSEDDSLRGMILRQPIKLDVHSVGGAPKVIEVVVRKESNPHEVLFNLFLKNDRGNWKLESIEYD
jgi:hypothetical protein